MKLATALTNIINLVLEGGVPDEILPIFYGGSLCALTKPNGGVRPIAAGNTLRRLAVKVASELLVDTLGEEFRPVQLGYGTKGGCEGAAHAARTYLANQTGSKVFLKIDVSNAFNCLRRDIFLARVREKVPSLYKLLWQAYSQPSKLFFGDHIIESSEGIQQGDPFGPALFALSVDPIAKDMRSEFNVWYLDDACIAGDRDTVLHDLENMVTKLGELGLSVNSNKCEVTLLEHTEQEAAVTTEMVQSFLPGVRIVPKEDCCLLGALLSVEGIPAALKKKTEDLDKLISRLEFVDPHEAFVLLKNCFSIPRLQYILRTSPTFLCQDELVRFDEK